MEPINNFDMSLNKPTCKNFEETQLLTSLKRKPSLTLTDFLFYYILGASLASVLNNRLRAHASNSQNAPKPLVQTWYPRGVQADDNSHIASRYTREKCYIDRNIPEPEWLARSYFTPQT